MEKLNKLPNVVVFAQQQVGLVGFPDLIMLVNGKFWAWELKKDTKSKPSKMQVYYLDKIVKANGYGTVVTPENFEIEYSKIVKELAHYL